MSVGYKGAIAVGRAVVTEEGRDSVTKGRAAKETFRVSPPGLGDWTTLPGVGVVGAVTDVRGSGDLDLG